MSAHGGLCRGSTGETVESISNVGGEAIGAELEPPA